MKKQKESDLVKTCLEYLEVKRIFHYRQNSGAFKTDRGGFYRMGVVGAPDIIAVVSGVYVGIEVKIAQNKLSEGQFSFGERLVKAGGIYMVVRSLDDLISELKTLK